MPNRLSKESSPYLLQHAHNPVDWYPWGEEALKKAKEEDKPILVSIGYSACHWCHVMERESFEDIAVADIMNAHFINIKIDREERPDLDHIYMDAVQAMTGSGGWPLNVFLTPAAKPFYGGTYFPPRRAYNRPSWTEILQSIRQAYQTKRDDIETQAETLTSHLSGPLNFSKNKKEKQVEDFTVESLGQIREKILQTADRQSGGFGHAPKFPQTFIIQYLLRDYYLTGNQDAVEQACLSLDKMIQGGIYDQIGGGFARYATDNDWLVPHFEKMLYDNALLVSVISEAWQVTRKDHYREAITQTLDFIARELTAPDGGFYSALDADSEGEEGKYYVWERQEVENLLGKDAGLFCEFYDISEGGNWEGRNIPHIRHAREAFAIQNGMKINELEETLAHGRQILLKNRSKRIRPQLDDKQLLGWNALMITAYCKAFAALGIDSYRDTAIRSMEFIWQKFRGEGIRHFHHSYKNGKASIPAFLDDYASLIQGLIQLQEITGDAAYLLKARELTEWVLENFSDPEGGQFYFTHRDQEDLIIRKKEIYDGAVPSGNSVMASNLLYLSIVFDKPDWKEIAARSCKEIYDLFKDFPGSFGVWATLAQGLAYGMNEIVVTGKKPDDILKELLSIFLPFRVLQSATTRNDQFPLLLDKPASDQTLIFLCRDYSCQIPVTEVHELVPLLETVQKF